MSETMFNAGGLNAPQMVGRPAAARGSTGSDLSPGCSSVTSFETAKEFARGEGPTSGSYTPYQRPGRVATRIARPDSPALTGVKTL
jgi:hypothetical protein